MDRVPIPKATELKVNTEAGEGSLTLTNMRTMTNSWSFSQSYFYDCRITVNQFVLATSPLRLTTSNFIFQLITCGYSSYVTSSLMRGCVCSLRLLLALASAVILKSESRRIHDHILLSQIRGSSNLEGQVPVFISPRNRVARLYPRHWVPFPSPPTTRRPTVEVRLNKIQNITSCRTETTETDRLILFREMIAVYCENQTKHALCEQRTVLERDIRRLIRP
jgi:hypothetical protein